MTWDEFVAKAKSVGCKVVVFEDVWGNWFTEHFPPYKTIGGQFILKWILIRRHLFGTQRGADIGEHELVHVEQFKRSWYLPHILLYLLSPYHRCKLEIEAYKVDLRRASAQIGYVTGAKKAWLYNTLRGPLYWYYGRLVPGLLKMIEKAASEVEQELRDSRA